MKRFSDKQIIDIIGEVVKSQIYQKTGYMTSYNIIAMTRIITRSRVSTDYHLKSLVRLAYIQGKFPKGFKETFIKVPVLNGYKYMHFYHKVDINETKYARYQIK